MSYYISITNDPMRYIYFDHPYFSIYMYMSLSLIIQIIIRFPANQIRPTCLDIYEMLICLILYAFTKINHVRYLTQPCPEVHNLIKQLRKKVERVLRLPGQVQIPNYKICQHAKKTFS